MWIRIILWLLKLGRPTGKDKHTGAYRTPFDLLPEPAPQQVEAPKEIKRTTKLFQALQKTWMKMDFWELLGRISVTVLLLAATALIAFGGYAIVKSMHATKKTDFCFISHHDGDGINDYLLNGHVEWGSDRQLGRFNKFEEAVAAAKLIDCKIVEK